MSDTFIFRISRVFDAPTGRVWKAWTDMDMSAKWFGPKGCKASYRKFETKAGGEWSSIVEWNGMTMYGRWSHKEVVPQKKLVSIVSFTDETGVNLVPHPGHPNWPKEVYSTVTFIEQDKQTEVLVEWKAYNPSAIEAKTFTEGNDSMAQGWGGSFDVLAELLSK